MDTLCLDTGDRNIGLAISDLTPGIRWALCYTGKVQRNDIYLFKEILKECDITVIAIDLPKDLADPVG
jgi:RNase H-fold protein (predicted Holliday junction resolvase)